MVQVHGLLHPRGSPGSSLDSLPLMARCHPIVPIGEGISTWNLFLFFSLFPSLISLSVCFSNKNEIIYDFKDLDVLLESQHYTYTIEGRERENLHLLVHSPNDYHGYRWVVLKLGASSVAGSHNFLQVSHAGA